LNLMMRLGKMTNNILIEYKRSESKYLLRWTHKM
jgi:hypothetical protein